MIHTKLAAEIPAGYAGLIYARSGMAVKKGLAPANKVGVVDADYRGEIMVALYNHSPEDRFVEDGDRIAQMVITPVPAVELVEAEELGGSVRGEGGFGSTGDR
ncbi:MAG: dUTP diphosphatase, partial [Firmicutes bacterium]|nr:dUTP diphosphatase [Bacillota bacterium]